MARKEQPSIGKALGIVDPQRRPSREKKRVDLERAQSFIEGAEHGEEELESLEGLDPNATPRFRKNLVLNDYERALLTRHAQRTRLSEHRILRNFVVPRLYEAERGAS